MVVHPIQFHRLSIVPSSHTNLFALPPTDQSCFWLRPLFWLLLLPGTLLPRYPHGSPSLSIWVLVQCHVLREPSLITQPYPPLPPHCFIFLPSMLPPPIICLFVCLPTRTNSSVRTISFCSTAVSWHLEQLEVHKRSSIHVCFRDEHVSFAPRGA